MIGMGYYNCHTPSVILRNVLENPAWYTAYTPYQPESRRSSRGAPQFPDDGRRSHRDGNRECLVTRRGHGGSRSHGLMSSIERAAARPLRLVAMPPADNRRFAPALPDRGRGDRRRPSARFQRAEVFGVLLQYPASTGEIFDYADLVKKAHAKRALVTVAADLLSLDAAGTPAEFGADVVVGTAQRFGVPLGYGGPHAGFMATKEAYKRALPRAPRRRLRGQPRRPAYRLAMQTREQHIRREKATSNICTAQALLPSASMYAVYHGPDGLTAIARRVHRLTAILAEGLSRLRTMWRANPL